MHKRAVICIGVNQAGNLRELRAAAEGATDFSNWALSQKCDTQLLIDSNTSRVTIIDIFEAVDRVVESGTYHQLIIYFSGHGILSAPNTEYWLLSKAPQNPNEAVNLIRSVDDARNSGIPHVIFISDACRSAVQGPPMSGISGGLIFPNRPPVQQRSEVDIFYAANPGNPAYEVTVDEAANNYRNIFTDCLLGVLRKPDDTMVESVDRTPLTQNVITSRSLKLYLEQKVPIMAGEFNYRIRQQPEVRVETALPKYFAVLPDINSSPLELDDNGPSETDDQLPEFKKLKHRKSFPTVSNILQQKQEEDSIRTDAQELLKAQAQNQLFASTGFTISGAEVVDVITKGWDIIVDKVDKTDREKSNSNFSIDLRPMKERRRSTSLLLVFKNGNGVVLSILPDFIGQIIVKQERMVSLNYVPSPLNNRYPDYRWRAAELEEMKASAAVASRRGRFTVDIQRAVGFADQIRQSKDLDPTMGLYASYAYVQAGLYQDVLSVYSIMQRDRMTPLLFDIVMLATRYRPLSQLLEKNQRLATFAPLLSQGWAFLMPGDPLHKPIHKRLRPHIVPSLWTTYAPGGVEIIRNTFYKKSK